MVLIGEDLSLKTDDRVEATANLPPSYGPLYIIRQVDDLSIVNNAYAVCVFAETWCIGILLDDVCLRSQNGPRIFLKCLVSQIDPQKLKTSERTNGIIFIVEYCSPCAQDAKGRL